ncbi:MAG: Flp pilus assembly complex ATPase component TadA [Sedimentisphaerales bacterium]|nr:Flp pilus assembly complex ATPase component TadA [Sedimentisphaerales bacterium]
MNEKGQISRAHNPLHGRRLGEELVSRGILTSPKLEEALQEQKLRGGRLGQVLTALGIISDTQLAEALGNLFSIDSVHLEPSSIDMRIARLLPEAVAQRHSLVAIEERNGKVVVAVADPLDVIAVDTVETKMRREVEIVISTARQIRKAIEIIYHGSDIDEQRLRDLVELEISSDDEPGDSTVAENTEADINVEEAATRAPVIRFVDLLLRQAVKSRASDIHVEPEERSMTIRMRIDGVLRDMVPPPRRMQAAVATRMKILAKMDIAERRLPQDGRFKIKAPGRDIDVRVSVIPTIYGEKVVMRILDAAAVDHNLDRLGFEPALLEVLKIMLKQPHGIIVVTGPTGSGKSTTLYSALNWLKDPKKNITTVEDPVEYRLKGINQVQVKPEIGLDFASSLRAILRQDPDIVLIGEIRDKETIDIAIKASLTGHLVLSTFHTNDAPSAISRMVYMGVEPYLLASTLNLVIAQRLVARVCQHCKEPVKPDEKILKRLNITPALAAGKTFYVGAGCGVCEHTGYLGRIPIFEFLVVSREIREALLDGASESRIRELSRQKGYWGLLESGVSKVFKGLTTAEQVLTTTYTEDVELPATESNLMNDIMELQGPLSKRISNG